MKRGAIIAQMKRTSINAVLAFVFALAGLVLVFVPSQLTLCLRILATALLFAVAAVIQLKQSKGSLVGKDYAAAGIIISLFAILLCPVLQKVWVWAQDEGCESNMKQIGRAIDLYAKDHNGKYPPEKWQDAVRPYVKDEHIFRCPNYTEDVPTYAMNIVLAGKSMSAIKDPHNTVLLFESVPGRNLAGGPEFLPEESRHSNYTVVLFADGTVRSCHPSRLRELRACRWKVNYNE